MSAKKISDRQAKTGKTRIVCRGRRGSARRRVRPRAGIAVSTTLVCGAIEAGRDLLMPTSGGSWNCDGLGRSREAHDGAPRSRLRQCIVMGKEGFGEDFVYLVGPAPSCSTNLISVSSPWRCSRLKEENIRRLAWFRNYRRPRRSHGDETLAAPITGYSRPRFCKYSPCLTKRNDRNMP